MEKSKIIKFGVVVLLLIAMIIGVFTFMQYTKQKMIREYNAKQRQVIETYFSYINEKKYEEMYELLSKESKEAISKEDFVKRNKNIYNGIDATNNAIYEVPSANSSRYQFDPEIVDIFFKVIDRIRAIQNSFPD